MMYNLKVQCVRTGNIIPEPSEPGGTNLDMVNYHSNTVSNIIPQATLDTQSSINNSAISVYLRLP